MIIENNQNNNQSDNESDDESLVSVTWSSSYSSPISSLSPFIMSSNSENNTPIKNELSSYELYLKINNLVNLPQKSRFRSKSFGIGNNDQKETILFNKTKIKSGSHKIINPNSIHNKTLNKLEQNSDLFENENLIFYLSSDNDNHNLNENNNIKK